MLQQVGNGHAVFGIQNQQLAEQISQAQDMVARQLLIFMQAAEALRERSLT